jgi:hypothetical protein
MPSGSVRKLRPWFVALACAGLLLGLPGCSQQNDDPAAAVAAYFQALADQNADEMIETSCADWEAQVYLELHTLKNASATLSDLNCREIGREDETALVGCGGTIRANFGTGFTAIDLAERSYTAIKENGKWLMCGYR